jgi:predicted component of type VI protein secretion system
LGKVVHYHFDKVTHATQPTADASKIFFIMRPNSNYVVEESADGEQDPPTLRARPTWVSSDENKDLIQKEIILEAMENKNFFSIGRSMKREVQIKLKAVSADHCNLTYDHQQGWFISESGKDKASSNGTFVFMKSQKQMQDHEPSSLIPLHHGMVISFINYEIKVTLDNKSAEDLDAQRQNLTMKKAQMQEASSNAAGLSSTLPAQVTTPIAPEQPTEEVKEEAAHEAPQFVD